jgi:uncharacterized C2H2 Zn-finger protein
MKERREMSGTRKKQPKNDSLGQNEDFICPRCTKILPTRRGWTSHMRQKHPDWPNVDEILGKKVA